MKLTHNYKLKTQNFILCVSVCGIVFFAGCEESQKKEAKPVIESQKQLKESPVKLKQENEQLKKQIDTLMAIGKEARTEALSTLTAVEISRRTGLYKKAETGRKERLVVYLKPIDDMGDVVKAAGQVEAELWNLNAQPEAARLGQWKIEPAELKKNWTSSFMSSSYKLQFDVGSLLKGDEKELTLKVRFTDYLSGKIFNSQIVINK